MNFQPTENQVLIAETVRKFAETHIRPDMMKWDEEQLFPVELFRKMGEQGLMGILVPHEYGGSGLSYFEYMTAIVEVARVCGSIGLSMAAHNSLCTGHILAFGNEQQKQQYLPKLASGQWIGAWGLTEANTGSDAMRMQCVAKQDGDHWVINGSKNWITHGKSGDVAVVLARTGDLLDSKGITAFIVERGTQGFKAGKKENKLGMRASETAELIFEDCRIHKDQVLGNVGDGFVQAMKVLDGGRISIASLALGIAKGAYDAALKYSRERQQFGKPIADFQAIGFKLADMATQIDAARLMVLRAATLREAGKPCLTEASMAKLFASEMAERVISDAIQIHGGYGYLRDYPVERIYRDVRVCQIYEGTSEVQRLVIARGL